MRYNYFKEKCDLNISCYTGHDSNLFYYCRSTSNEQTKDGQPCGTIRAKGSGYDITVWNLDHCAIVLGAAGTNKMNETRNCLEANFDPTAVIVGDRFATVSAVADNDAYFRFKEEVRKDQEKEGASEGAYSKCDVLGPVAVHILVLHALELYVLIVPTQARI